MMMFSTCMVTLGTTLSVTWILVANSWMQTPSGYKVVNGQFQPVDWLHVIFNPSFGIRFIHMLVGVLLTAAWFIAGISAWYFVKGRHLPVARRGLSVALGVLVVALPLQMFLGDTAAGSYVAKYKLPELIAMEGNWNSTNTGENIIIVPKPSAERNSYQVTVPWMGSAIAKDWSGKTPTPGIETVPKALRPPLLPVFYGFHAMWVPTLLMMWAVVTSIALRLRGRLYTARWFHKLLVWMTPIGFLGIWGGWVTAETGRQPWIVYGKLLTAQAVSPLKPVPVLVSLILFIAFYVTLLGVFARYVVRAVREGPGDGPIVDPPAPSRQPAPLPSPAPAI
jgi:cytochrome d ubiquinol oxidase subunit I